MLKYNEYITESKDLRHPFIQAAIRGNNNKIKEFIKSGVDINMKDKYDKTALMYAVTYKFLLIVRTLLDAGADPNLQDNDGKTALMMASTSKIFDKILDAGADVNIVDKNGETIVMSRFNEFTEENYRIIFENLISKGLDLSIRNKSDENFYEKLKKQENVMKHSYFKSIERNGEIFTKMIKYIDQKFPQYKEEWELKQAIDKYNL